MDDNERVAGRGSREEAWIAGGGLALVVLAAAAMSPFDAGFLGNFRIYLLQQALALVPLLVQRPRLSVLAGAMFSVAACTAAFPAWCHLRHETPGWALFWWCLPGACIGSFMAGLAALRWKRRSATFCACAAAAVVLAALLANAVIVEVPLKAAHGCSVAPCP